RIRVLHTVDMADLARKVKDQFLISDQVSHAVLVPHIGDVKAHPVRYFPYVKQVPAISRNKGINYNDGCAQRDKSDRQVAANEPKPSCDHYFLPGEVLPDFDTNISFHDEHSRCPARDTGHFMLAVPRGEAPDGTLEMAACDF